MDLALLDLHAQRHVIDRLGVRQRQVIGRRHAVARQLGHIHDPDRAGAGGGQRIDPRAVHVALHLLDEPRVHPLADLRLEDATRLLLRDDDAIDQLTVEIDGVAAYHRPLGQREEQRALERASVRIAEGQRLRRLREHPADESGDLEPLEHDLRFARGNLHVGERIDG